MSVPFNLGKGQNIYDHFECEVSKVIDKHVPVKHRYPRKKLSPIYEQRIKKSNLQQTNAKK